MSRRFVESFFPSTTALLRHFVPTVVQYFFPSDLDARCPEVTWTTASGMMIRNPLLALSTLVGVWIGCYGAWFHYYNNFQRQYGWAAAFATFGAMNAVALPLHCLLPVSSSPATAYCPAVCWLLDCTLTGTSCLCLVQGSAELTIQMLRQQQRRQSPGWPLAFLQNALKWWVKSGVQWGHAAMVLCIFLSWGCPVSVVQVLTGRDDDDDDSNEHYNNNDWWEEPLWIEWCYLGPFLVALYICPLATLGSIWYAYFYNKNNKEKDLWFLLGSVTVMSCGVVMGMLAITGVDWFCRYFPTDLAMDAFSAPTLMFAGCNLSFIGLHFWLLGVKDVVGIAAEDTVLNDQQSHDSQAKRKQS